MRKNKLKAVHLSTQSSLKAWRKGKFGRLKRQTKKKSQYISHNNLTIYFPVWLGLQGVIIMFLSQCTSSCFHSLPIPISQPFGNPAK